MTRLTAVAGSTSLARAPMRDTEVGRLVAVGSGLGRPVKGGVTPGPAADQGTARQPSAGDPGQGSWHGPLPGARRGRVVWELWCFDPD